MEIGWTMVVGFLGEEGGGEMLYVFSIYFCNLFDFF